MATARHLNFVRAAEGTARHVRQPSGSRFCLLEDYLGQPLFNRVRGQLQLTPAGLALMPGLTDAFDAVLAAMAQFATSDHEQPIRVSVAPSFASKWLIPRLDTLRRAAPGLQVLVDASTQLTNLDAGDADCVIRYGSGPYPGLVVDHLFSEAVLPVCSPEFADAHSLWDGPQAIEGVPLLHEEGAEHDQSCPDWSGWLRAAGALLPSVARRVPAQPILSRTGCSAGRTGIGARQDQACGSRDPVRTAGQPFRRAPARQFLLLLRDHCAYGAADARRSVSRVAAGRGAHAADNGRDHRTSHSPGHGHDCRRVSSGRGVSHRSI